MKKLVVFTNFPLLPTKGYREFFNILFGSGKIELADVNNPLSADLSICFNHTDENLKKIVSAGIPVEKRHLVMYECEQILPKMHKKEILSQYGKIYSASPLWAVDHSPVVFKYGFFLECKTEPPPFSSRKYEFGIVQRNKYSCVKGELYTLRRAVIILASKEKIQLALRGEDWEKSRFRTLYEYFKLVMFHIFKNGDKNLELFPKSISVKGKFKSSPVLDKQEFLATIKVAIIIENSANYVSEKLFDAFRAGAVPIYVGPDLNYFGIPTDAVIQASKTASSVIQIMKNISNYDLEAIRSKGWEFLNGIGRSWSEVEVMGKLAERVLDEI